MVHKQNKIESLNEYALINFYNSTKKAIIDLEDIEKIKPYCFYLDNKGYARARKGKDKIFLHHLIIGKPEKGLVVDHINRNCLDNRKSNLRITTYQTNILNAKINKNNKTGVKNVHFDKNTGKYRARIKRDGKMIHIGLYKDLEEAKKAIEPYNINDAPYEIAELLKEE